jgi:hypothetical protein
VATKFFNPGNSMKKFWLILAFVAVFALGYAVKTFVCSPNGGCGRHGHHSGMSCCHKGHGDMRHGGCYGKSGSMDTTGCGRHGYDDMSCCKKDSLAIVRHHGNRDAGEDETSAPTHDSLGRKHDHVKHDK